MKPHEIEKEEKVLSRAKGRVLHLLCHMFGVIPVHPCTKNVLPCLDPLEKQVESVLRDHNKKVRGVFQEFCAQANRTDKTYEMPLSHVKFQGEKKENEKNATSPFVSSISSFDLRACRHDVYVDESMIPVVELDGKRKSSWLIDLLAHHDLGRIHREHNITPERVYQKASKFMNAVRSACQALKMYVHMFKWDDDVAVVQEEEKKKKDVKKEKEVEEEEEENDDKSGSSSSDDEDWDVDGVADNWENAFDSDSNDDDKDDDDEDEDKTPLEKKKKKRANSMSAKGLDVERLELVHEIMEMVLNDVSVCVNESFDTFSYTNETKHLDWIESVLKN